MERGDSDRMMRGKAQPVERANPKRTTPPVDRLLGMARIGQRRTAEK